MFLKMDVYIDHVKFNSHKMYDHQSSSFSGHRCETFAKSNALNPDNVKGSHHISVSYMGRVGVGLGE